MKTWFILAGAIVLEVGATLALRAAMDNPWWAVLTVLGYAGAFVALTAVIASAVFGEPFTFTIGIGIALVIAGVVLVETGHDAPAVEPSAGSTELAELARSTEQAEAPEAVKEIR